MVINMPLPRITTRIDSPTEKRVLIARCGYRKAYPVIESLKKAGYKIFAGIDNNSRIFLTEAFSRYVNCVVRVANPNVSEKKYIASVIDVVKKNKINIIIPIGFVDFMLLSKFKNVIKDYAVVPVEDYEKMKMVSNKWILCKIAREAGVRYPNSLLIKLPKNFKTLDEFVNEVNFPLVIKGISDASNPIFIGNRESLVKTLRNFKSDVLLQEFIVGVGVGYFCLSQRGEPLVEFMHQRILEATPLGGASIKACSNFDEELLELGRKIVKNIKWSGVIMAEFKKDLETGEYYLLEINPKFWGSLELAYRAGVDFPRYLVELFLEGKRPKNLSYKYTCFSWVSDGLSTYSKYGFRTLREVLPHILSRSPLMSDLHVFDPLNTWSKVAVTSFSMLRGIFYGGRITENYITGEIKEVLTQLKGIILDFDGTIVRLNIPWNRVKSELLRSGIIKVFESIQEAFYKYRSAGDVKKFNKMNEIVHKYELKAVQNLTSNSGFIDIIRRLKEKALKISIVSKQSKNALVEGLKRMGLLELVDVVIGREDFVLRNEQIREALRRMFSSSCFPRCVMLGDTLADVKGALKAGVIPVMVVGNSNIKRIQLKELNISYFGSVVQALNFIYRGVYDRRENMYKAQCT